MLRETVDLIGRAFSSSPQIPSRSHDRAVLPCLSCYSCFCLACLLYLNSIFGSIIRQTHSECGHHMYNAPIQSNHVPQIAASNNQCQMPNEVQLEQAQTMLLIQPVMISYNTTGPFPAKKINVQNGTATSL